MKRKIFSVLAIASIAFVSCKKEELDSTELGSATINGNVWADMDMTAPGVEGVEGMEVKIEVNTQDWDQQSIGGYNYDKKVYTATTDANGDYTFTIPATDEGYNVTMEYEDVYTDRTNADGSTQTVVVTRGNITKFIYSGANITTIDEATVNPWNTTSYGMATVKGTVFIETDYAFWDGNDGYEPFTTSIASTFGLPSDVQVQWMYEDGDEPYGIADQVVRFVDIDFTTGTYEFTVSTEAPGLDNVWVYFGIDDFDGQAHINNDAGTADSLANGYYTVGSQIFEENESLDAGEIENTDIYIYWNQY